MRARRRLLGLLLLAGCGVSAAVAGCKDKESLVVVTLQPGAEDASVDKASVDIGGTKQTFDLPGKTLPAAGVSFGVYVPSSLKGVQPITALAWSSQAGSCVGEMGTGQVDIMSAGGLSGPVTIPMAPSAAGCPGTGGSSGTAGTPGTGGTPGIGGTLGSGGATGTGGAGGRGGAGSGGLSGHGGGAAGNYGKGGSPGMGGHGGIGGSGTGGAPVGGASGNGISACSEYDHGDPGQCATSACSNDYAIYGAAFSPKNANLAVTSGTDGRTKVWTIKSDGTMSAEGHVVTGTGLGAVAFSPDGTQLAIGQDGGVQIVNVSTWVAVRTLTVASMVYGVAFSPDGTQVITLDTDSSSTPTSSHLYVHGVTNPTALYSVALTSGWALGVSPVATAGALAVAVTTTTGNALVYTLTAAGFSAPTTLTVTSDQSYAETAQFSPTGALLAAGGDDGILQFWPVPITGAKQAPSIDVNSGTNGNSDWVDVVAFSPDGSELTVGAGFFGSVTSYATATRTRTGNEQDTSSNYDVSALGYSPNGKWIIGGEADCGCVFLCQH